MGQVQQNALEKIIEKKVKLKVLKPLSKNIFLKPFKLLMLDAEEYQKQRKANKLIDALYIVINHDNAYSLGQAYQVYEGKEMPLSFREGKNMQDLHEYLDQQEIKRITAKMIFGSSLRGYRNSLDVDYDWKQDVIPVGQIIEVTEEEAERLTLPVDKGNRCIDSDNPEHRHMVHFNFPNDPTIQKFPIIRKPIAYCERV